MGAVIGALLGGLILFAVTGFSRDDDGYLNWIPWDAFGGGLVGAIAGALVGFVGWVVAGLTARLLFNAKSWKTTTAALIAANLIGAGVGGAACDLTRQGATWSLSQMLNARPGSAFYLYQTVGATVAGLLGSAFVLSCTRLFGLPGLRGRSKLGWRYAVIGIVGGMSGLAVGTLVQGGEILLDLWIRQPNAWFRLAMMGVAGAAPTLAAASVSRVCVVEDAPPGVPENDWDEDWFQPPERPPAQEKPSPLNRSDP